MVDSKDFDTGPKQPKTEQVRGQSKAFGSREVTRGPSFARPAPDLVFMVGLDAAEGASCIP
jgi:hypothetical protein